MESIAHHQRAPQREGASKPPLNAICQQVFTTFPADQNDDTSPKKVF